MKLPISLIKVTEEIGKDITLVQGPGGNISYKEKDYIYIKASGTKMAEAKINNIFVKANLNSIISAIENNDNDPIKNNWEGNEFMKPSIETSLFF